MAVAQHNVRKQLAAISEVLGGLVSQLGVPENFEESLDSICKRRQVSQFRSKVRETEASEKP